VPEAPPPPPPRSSELTTPGDPPAAPRSRPRPRSAGSIFRPPLWLRWVLSLGVGAVLIVLLVRFVQHNSGTSPANESPAAAVRANREAEVLVAQDQAPRVARLAAGVAPATALQHATHADIAHLIAQGVINGPVGHSTCTPTGARATTPRGFRCTVVAANFNYQFVGVVDTRTRRITLCKRDPPPVPSQNVPVSPRCLA
jgi:hypothetical protein